MSDSPIGIATLTATKSPGIGMVEVAVPGHVSASDFWDRAEREVKSMAVEEGYSILELLTWDAGLRGELQDRGWKRVRVVNRGARTNATGLSSGAGDAVDVFQREHDAGELLEVNNLAFGSHPEARNWDLRGLEVLFEEPWFDPAGLLVTRDGPVVSGFCWTKVHPDGVGEVYLLAVRPEYSGRGLGRALIVAGVEYLTIGRGCARNIVYWDASNSVASNLYQSIGFSVDRVGEVFRRPL